MKTDLLIQKLSRDVSPVRPLRHPLIRYFFWLCMSLPFVATVALWIGLRTDLGVVFYEPSFFSQVAVLLILSVTAASSAFFLGVPDLRNHQFMILSGVVSIGWLAVFGILLVSGFGIHPGTGFGCLRNILVLSVPPAGLLYYLLSRAVPLSRNVAGLFGFVGAASLGCLATRFICPNDDLLHFFVWHCIPVIVSGGIGLVLGLFLLRK